jgi:hypothetical protein
MLCDAVLRIADPSRIAPSIAVTPCSLPDRREGLNPDIHLLGVIVCALWRQYDGPGRPRSESERRT